MHVSAEARRRYAIEGALLSPDGRLVFADPLAARRLARRLADRAEPGEGPAAEGGDLFAAAVIHDVFHRVVRRYLERVDPAAFEAARTALERSLGRAELDRLLEAVRETFPPGSTETGPGLTAPPEGSTAELLERLLVVWLQNANPAMAPLRHLFDDRPLAAASAYEAAIRYLAAAFAARPPVEGRRLSLVAFLRSPAVEVPDSLTGQLRYIRERWADLVGDLFDRLDLALDLLDEEALARWRRFHGAGLGPPSPAAPSFVGLEAEAEAYSPDRDWMPRVVLMAKSTYVWLDQLSRRYGRPIRRLDDIPDEELDTLARWGMTGLWLIGLWQRSRASAKIKQLRGNPDALASAYALDEYRIADDLGGEPAWANLRDRAAARGIRLASDMVPNHMGIDSRWVIEHPEWFLSLPEPPFPSYTFSGPDLSDDPRVGIFIEDHYWDGSDAAVVFRRHDRRTGEDRYIYHGNDGTSLPWNDTAQLNYLDPVVREQVIATILDVARRFPIIRFDAAMTLARRHIQRLWFPEPGTAGAIPSRAEHGLSRAAFEAAMPTEFWRDVVDRVAAEAPDTLLLAEAFWLMEGYFVRTLGMHRVYNSAFMHMLRDERNAEYRQLIRSTLEFDPEILKRYVNFMNNPDERTAVDQFGKGDKYFAVATLLATLPGLPMFGHGQVEGFTEKYGMEFRRAYYDEAPDPWLVERHEREIFPLLHRRADFAEVADFRFYDFVTDDGGVDENVFAYSNGRGATRSLVVVHNRYAATTGRIRDSVAFSVADGNGDGGGRRLVRTSLAEALGLPDDPGAWVIARDHVRGQEVLWNAAALRRDGLRLELGAYERRVFLDLRDVHDGTSGIWSRLAERLAGRPVASMEDALWELELDAVHGPLRAIFGDGLLGRLLEAAGEPGTGVVPGDALLDEIEGRVVRFAAAVAGLTRTGGDPGEVGRAARRNLTGLLAVVGRDVLASAGDRRRPTAGSAAESAVEALGPFVVDRW
ncbi:MAG TPA: alpha-amylase family glycosyl hydrolase, partial [Candidatus Binatia bacterium]|nr:alpha-amylase family glycosyl hydrolase [Candidatus Binatia bacterium]